MLTNAQVSLHPLLRKEGQWRCDLSVTLAKLHFDEGQVRFEVLESPRRAELLKFFQAPAADLAPSLGGDVSPAPGNWDLAAVQRLLQNEILGLNLGWSVAHEGT